MLPGLDLTCYHRLCFLAVTVLRIKKQPAAVKVISSKETTQVKIIPKTTGNVVNAVAVTLEFAVTGSCSEDVLSDEEVEL